MANPVAEYICVGVRSQGTTRERQRTFAGAPSDARLATWARSSRPPLDMITRYFPRKKGWVVFDMRGAVSVAVTGYGSTYFKWIGITRHPTLFPTEAAAVMAMMHILQRAAG